jgi:hypothetical protein
MPLVPLAAPDATAPSVIPAQVGTKNLAHAWVTAYAGITV